MKMLFSLLLVFGFLSATQVFAQDTDVSKVAKHLQEISVTIKANGSQGSGVIFSRTNNTGEIVNFVWTAAHVVDTLRKEREIIAPDGSKKTVVEFDDAQVVKILVEDGRDVGRTEFDARILKFSHPENGHDLAILMIRKKNFIKTGVEFANTEIPTIGTRMYHVGSLKGQFGANSMTDGILSQVGRLINSKEFDQATCNVFPGSSGGGIYLTNGKYVGMITRAGGESFALYVPLRRVMKWAELNGVKWAMDNSVKLPTDEELTRLQVEDVVPSLKSSSSPTALKP